MFRGGFWLGLLLSISLAFFGSNRKLFAGDLRFIMFEGSDDLRGDSTDLWEESSQALEVFKNISYRIILSQNRSNPHELNVEYLWIEGRYRSHNFHYGLSDVDSAALDWSTVHQLKGDGPLVNPVSDRGSEVPSIELNLKSSSLIKKIKMRYRRTAAPVSIGGLGVHLLPAEWRFPDGDVRATAMGPLQLSFQSEKGATSVSPATANEITDKILQQFRNGLYLKSRTFANSCATTVISLLTFSKTPAEKISLTASKSI